MAQVAVVPTSASTPSRRSDTLQSMTVFDQHREEMLVHLDVRREKGRDVREEKREEREARRDETY